MLTQPESEIYYRYEFYAYSRIPELETYPVVKHTLCCTAITYNGKPKYITNHRANMWGKQVPTRKRFAYPTKEEALVAFKARKNRQLKILTGQVEQVKHILKIMETFDPNENPLVVAKKYDTLYDLFDFEL